MADLPETDGKNLVELLDMLKPIPEPPPISMWPATQGWIWLGLALLAGFAYAGYRAWAHWRANAYRRAALAELDAAGDDPVTVATILRRTALVAYPRSEVASLTGDAWCAFLDRTSRSGGFASETGDLLTKAPWRGGETNPEANGLARRWIKGHRREGTE